MNPRDSWLLVGAVIAAFATIGFLLLEDIDRWLDEWRDQGVDRSFERTRQQIRALPERPYDLAEEEVA